ncbi:BlaI/MecI/CopY family transcriptional regulator [Streptomyces spectabilis]|uniref:BlaI/MecI/CopY family transcriptional regulator n=1 Tax=Streptomyces spectabilis TaxID=68270 RepID=UPI0033C841D2
MSSQSAAKLRSRYVEQVASELTENRRRQEELAKKIELLKQEETLLTDILTLAERYEGFADASRLPEQAQDEPVVAQAAAKGRAQDSSRQPLLGDLLLELLTGHDEPRPAKELRDELLAKHPGRNPTPQVVRNTLESLVAKGRVERHKQQRSVLYTPVTSGATD